MHGPHSLASLYQSPVCLRARTAERLRFADMWQAIMPTHRMPANARTQQRLYVSDSLRAAYLSNPKAAHLAVLKIFRYASIAKHPGQGELTYREVPLIGHDRHASFLKTLPSNYTLFTFVREPVSAFLSGYAEVVHRVLTWNRARKIHGSDTTFSHVRCSRSDTDTNSTRFAAFLDDLTRCRTIGYDAYHVWPQVMKLDALPGNGERSFDFVGRIESLAADMGKLLRQIQGTEVPQSVIELTTHVSHLTNVDECNKIITVPSAAVVAALPVLCDLLAADFKCTGYPLPSSCVQFKQNESRQPVHRTGTESEIIHSGARCAATDTQKAALFSTGQIANTHAALYPESTVLPRLNRVEMNTTACGEVSRSVHLKSTGICFGVARLGKGQVAAEDQPTYLIDSLPAQLDGALWFRAPHRVVTRNGDAHITLAFEPMVYTANVWLYWNSRAGLSAPVALKQLSGLGFQPAGAGPRYSRPGLAVPGPSTMWVHRYERTEARIGVPGVVPIGPLSITIARGGSTFGIVVTGVCMATVSSAPGCAETRSTRLSAVADLNISPLGMSHGWTAGELRSGELRAGTLRSDPLAPVSDLAQTPCSFFDDRANATQTLGRTAGERPVAYITRQAATQSPRVDSSLWTTFEHYAPIMSRPASWKTVAKCQHIGLNVSKELYRGNSHAVLSARWTIRNDSSPPASEVIVKCETHPPKPAQLAEDPQNVALLPRCGIEERLLPLTDWAVLEKIPPAQVHRVMQSLATVFVELHVRNMTFGDGGMHQFCVNTQFTEIKLCDTDMIYPPKGDFLLTNDHGPPEYYPYSAYSRRIDRVHRITSFEGDLFVLGSILTSISLVNDKVYREIPGSINASRFFCPHNMWHTRGRWGVYKIPCDDGTLWVGRARGLCALESAWEEDPQLRHWALQNIRLSNLFRLMCKHDPSQRTNISYAAHVLAEIRGERHN